MEQWSFNFGITPEEIEAQRQARKQLIQHMVDAKMCRICQNTYLINDQITMCSIKNECVDDECGSNCENWEALDVNQL